MWIILIAVLARQAWMALAGCSFVQDTPLLNGALTYRQYVNQQEETVTIQMVYQGRGWIGTAFSSSMVGSTAVIGLPLEGTVGLYNLGGLSVDQVRPLDDAEVLLTNASIVQTDMETTLTFTRSTKDENGNLVVSGGQAVDIIYAVGGSNQLAYHGFENRGVSQISFDVCDLPDSLPTGGVEAQQALGCSFQEDIPLGGNLVMRQVFNQQDNTLTVQLIHSQAVWLGFAFSSTGAMVGNTAVIGLPDDATTPVGFYNLGGRSTELVTLLDAEVQNTLQDASVEQTPGGPTVLTFTMPTQDSAGQALVVDGEASRIIYAVGIDNTLAYHGFRASTDIVFTTCVPLNPSASNLTVVPTNPLPTRAPIFSPTSAPSSLPTRSPTSTPTSAPSSSPTGTPTSAPTPVFTVPPEARPTVGPQPTPTPRLPSVLPTFKPTASPSAAPVQKSAPPTIVPSSTPSLAPSRTATFAPTESLPPSAAFSRRQRQQQALLLPLVVGSVLLVVVVG